jgi:recombination protein RecR
MLPKALVETIEELGNLPGVGSRTAERYAYFLLRAPQNTSTKLARSLGVLHENVKQCPKTFALIDADQDISSLYSNPERDKTVVAVVEEPFDVSHPGIQKVNIPFSHDNDRLCKFVMKRLLLVRKESHDVP